jgi:hypothetical protein
MPSTKKTLSKAQERQIERAKRALAECAIYSPDVAGSICRSIELFRKQLVKKAGAQ